MSQAMDWKKATAQAEKRKSLLVFVGEIKDELKKVSWTTKQELISCTKIVLGSTLIFGLGVYVVDLTIKGALELVKLVVHFIFG